MSERAPIFFDPAEKDLVQAAKDASTAISELLADPTSLNEGILDRLLREGREVTDLGLVWGTRRPMGAERLFDLSELFLTLDGPTRGPTADELQTFRNNLSSGDRLSTAYSRPTQWVVTTRRGKNVVCWGIEHPPGVEDNPEAPVYGDADGWAVWDLVQQSHLRREGKVLVHCVGNEDAGYGRDVTSGKCKIFSVREAGKSKCTIEYRDKRVVQTQGRAGRTLKEIGPEAVDVWEAFKAEVLDKR